MTDMEWKSAEFWGLYGRVARIRSGPWAGGMLFAYPDSAPGWWTIVVDPSPTPCQSGELYIDDAEYLAKLEREGEFEWLPLNEEEWELEQKHFDWRKELSPETRTPSDLQRVTNRIRRWGRRS